MKKNKRVVYVEDGDFASMFRSALKSGLKSDNYDVSVEHHENFDSVLRDIDSGDFADVYILDNEITDRSDQKGGDIAQKIYDRAHETDRDVLVITLLCSNTKAVKETYGDGLSQRGIPVIHKNMYASVCAFYIGRCINEGKTIPFDDWLRSEGIKIETETDTVGAAFLSMEGTILSTAEDKPGCFYLTPRAFIDNFGIRDIMDQKAKIRLDSVYPPQISKGIEAM